MGSVVKIKPNRRFFGPVSPEMAATLTDRVLGDEGLGELFERFARGEIDGPELAYEIECLYECEEERQLNPENHTDGLFEAKNQREEELCE